MPLPQRDGRPSLDLTPDATPKTASWVTQYNDPMNDRNAPVKEREGPADPNGWTKEMYDTNQDKDV